MVAEGEVSFEGNVRHAATRGEHLDLFFHLWQCEKGRENAITQWFGGLHG